MNWFKSTEGGVYITEIGLVLERTVTNSFFDYVTGDAFLNKKQNSTSMFTPLIAANTDSHLDNTLLVLKYTTSPKIVSFK